MFEDGVTRAFCVHKTDDNKILVILANMKGKVTIISFD